MYVVVVVDDVIMMTHEGHLRLLSGMSHGSLESVYRATTRAFSWNRPQTLVGEYVMGMGESVPCVETFEKGVGNILGVCR